MSNQERYDAARKALQPAAQTYQSQNYQTSIQNSEEAIRLARLIKALMQTAGTTYVVKWADCLWKIASFAAHYGDPSLWPKIWKANKHLIVDPDLIFPDQKFNIPPKE
jgi:nucleoid-associated protein YgaU